MPPHSYHIDYMSIFMKNDFSTSTISHMHCIKYFSCNYKLPGPPIVLQKKSVYKKNLLKKREGNGNGLLNIY